MLLRSISRLIGDIPLMCHIIPPCSSNYRIANDERTGYIPLLRSLTEAVCDSCAVVPLYPLARGMYIMLRPDCIYYPSFSMRSKIIDLFFLRTPFRQIIHGS